MHKTHRQDICVPKIVLFYSPSKLLLINFVLSITINIDND